MARLDSPVNSPAQVSVRKCHIGAELALGLCALDASNTPAPQFQPPVHDVMIVEMIDGGSQLSCVVLG